MDDATDLELTAWEETGAGRSPAMAEQSMLPSVSSHGTTPHRVDANEFARIVTPCLSLVAPVGMDLDSQDAWIESAYLALSDFPVDMIQHGAKVAMLVADHPSKVIPAIAAAIREGQERRRNSRPVASLVPIPFIPDEIDQSERDEVAKMMVGLARKLSVTAPKCP